MLLLTNDEGSEGIRRVAVSARADAMILMDVSMDDERIPMLRADRARLTGLGWLTGLAGWAAAVDCGA